LQSLRELAQAQAVAALVLLVRPVCRNYMAEMTANLCAQIEQVLELKGQRRRP
jgi:hypothetical protein